MQLLHTVPCRLIGASQSKPTLSATYTDISVLGFGSHQINQVKHLLRETFLKLDHKAFFAHGISEWFPWSSEPTVFLEHFQVLSTNSPIWSRAVDTLYLSSLQSIESDLGKKMLKLPKSTANNIPLLAIAI